MGPVATLLLCFGYAVISGIVFRISADLTDYPDRPFETPGPLLAAMMWPLALALILGIMIPSGSFKPGGRTERRRKRELAEAKHRVALAEKQAEETRILEREAGF